MRREPNHREESRRKRRLWRKRSTRVHRNPVQHHQVSGCVLFKTSELRLASEVGFTTLKCFYYWMNSKCVNRPWCMSYLEISIILYSLRITGQRGHAIALKALYGISLLHRVGFLLLALSHSLFVYPQLSSYHNKGSNAPKYFKKHNKRRKKGHKYSNYRPECTHGHWVCWED